MRYLVTILIIGVLIALHEMGHLLAARAMGMKVIRFSVGFFHPIASWASKRSGITYQIGAVPLGGFVQIKGMNPFEEGAYEDPDSYAAKPAWRRAVVILAGPVANFVAAWALFFGLYMGGSPEAVDESRVGYTVPGAPAEKAGLKADDAIVTFNGEPVSTWGELAGNLHKNPGKEVLLEVKRGEERLQIRVTPKDSGGRGLIGIGQPTRTIHLPPHVAALSAAVQCGRLAKGALTGLAGWMSGTGGDVQPVGPVGIVQIAVGAMSQGAKAFLAFVAYLSVMLFLFNLFPLPALDGGRGVFLLFEMVTRKRINRSVDMAVNTVGFLLLVGLLLLITAKEVIGLF